MYLYLPKSGEDRIKEILLTKYKLGAMRRELWRRWSS